jgi:pimeloyl-ACP methyl ester carboxylesterase
VAEYTYVLQVGPGQYDQIAVHRVVREEAEGVPAPSAQTIFMFHGDVWGFDPAFAGDVGRQDRAPNVATYLAQHDVDVWGSDRRWVLIDDHPDNFDFMADWDFSSDLGDLRLALALQQAVRALSGGGTGRTPLLGWSRGGQFAYAYASHEAGLPLEERYVDGIIPVDIALRYAPEDQQYADNNCASFRALRRKIDRGHYQTNLRFFHQVGRAAVRDPEGQSEFNPGLTNAQYAVYFGSQASRFFNPWFHFVSAPPGFPTEFTYTKTRQYFRMMTQSGTWVPLGTYADGAGLLCGKKGELVEHLPEVTAPVMYLSAAGGFGTTGDYSTTLVGSTDVSLELIRLLDPGQELRDFAHVDLLIGTDAQTLTWQPLLAWIEAHAA